MGCVTQTNGAKNKGDVGDDQEAEDRGYGSSCSMESRPEQSEVLVGLSWGAVRDPLQHRSRRCLITVLLGILDTIN